VQLYAPELGAWALPFIFNGPDHFNKVMDGPIGDELRRRLMAKSNLRLLSIYPNGERMFFNNKRPATKLADFKGIKIRVDDQPVSAQIWRLLGANPVPIAFAETYTALQSGVVDAAENPPLNIIKMKFFEVGKYVTLTRHSLTVQALMVNEPWWQKLPAADRDLVTAAIKDFTPERRQAAWDADAAAVDELRKLGAQVVPLENPAEFTKALAPMYESFGKRTGATELVQKIIAARP
jgi:tripartite ATP-independent transporter DctP family solute receptor